MRNPGTKVPVAPGFRCAQSGLQAPGAGAETTVGRQDAGRLKLQQQSEWRADSGQAAAFRRGRRADCFDGLAAEAAPITLRLTRGVALMSSSSTSSTTTIACGRLPFSARAN